MGLLLTLIIFMLSLKYEIYTAIKKFTLYDRYYSSPFQVFGAYLITKG
jgi:hypothetical protein